MANQSDNSDDMDKVFDKIIDFFQEIEAEDVKTAPRNSSNSSARATQRRVNRAARDARKAARDAKKVERIANRAFGRVGRRR